MTKKCPKLDDEFYEYPSHRVMDFMTTLSMLNKCNNSDWKKKTEYKLFLSSQILNKY